MGGIYFLVSPITESSPGLNWTAIGVWVSAIVGFITMSALVTTWWMAWADKKYRKSLLYLDKINNYLSKATTILTECKNNNVKWHQAINSLKEADNLKSSLTDKAHQSIYVANYIDVGYEIINILNKIDDFRFFYGVENYRDKLELDLYKEDKSFNNKVSPELLKCLCKFVDKVSKSDHDRNYTELQNKKIFKSSRFRESLNNFKLLTIANPSVIKIILDYIKSVEENDKDGRA